MNDIAITKAKEEYDVIIVGAGPAGCSAAKELSNEYKTLMVDSSVFPRSKPCGGILVDESIEFLKKIKPPLDIFSEPMEIDLEYVDIDNKLMYQTDRNFWNISRDKFDWWLLNRLENKEIDFLSKTKMNKFEAKKDSVEILLSGSESMHKVKTKTLIIANGSASFEIRNKLGLAQIDRYVGIQEIEVPNKNPHYNNFAIFIYDNSITDFYSWIIPKKSGLIIGSAVKLENSQKTFGEFKNKIRKIFKINVNGVKTEAALISRPKNISEIILGTNKRILFAGEAAGLISPTTGEGISYAMRSGKNAAESVNYSQENPYEKYVRLSKPLVDSIEQKIKVANEFSDSNLRLNIYKKMDKSKVINDLQLSW